MTLKRFQLLLVTKILTAMSIKIFVYSLRSGNEVVAYRNTLEVSNDLAVDFRKLYEVLRLLYPEAEVVTFSLIN